MGDSLDILVSGLNSFRGGLATTSNNIANATTEGYTRQRVNIVTAPSSRTGNIYFGSGSSIAGVDRIANEFVTLQLRNATSEASRLEVFNTFASRVDNLLADSDGNLNVTLQGFFDSLQDLSVDPNSGSLRQIVLSDANALTSRFQSLSSQLDLVEKDVNNNIGLAVNEINSLTQQIADLNGAISRSGGQSFSGQQPNDLIDQRDLAILRLSELTNVTTLNLDDGSVNVYIGSGQSAVTGTNVQKLTTVPNAADPSQTNVAFLVGSQTADVTNQLSGGELGGLVEFRSQIADYQNELGRIATVFADSFNTQHQQGININGTFGQDFFSVGQPEVINNLQNGGGGTITASLQDSSQLTGSDYEIFYDGVNYTLTRLQDGATNVSAAGVFSVDGVDFTATGTINTGDRFLIRPTANGAQSINVLLTNTNQIAAASPVRSSSAVENISDATISKPTVVDVTDADLRDTVQIQFNNPPTTFDLVNVTDATTIASGVAYTSGSAISVNGYQVTISGDPEVGDIFIIENNSSAVGDNSNVVALQNLQSAKTIQGSINYQEAYGGLVGNVGVVTQQSQISSQAQQRLLEDAFAARESLSGVNLDEEAINLTQYQQAYQAAAQAIAVTNNIFQTLLAAIN